MESWNIEVEPARLLPSDQTVSQALALQADRECPGSHGLCRAPLAKDEQLCPNCADMAEACWPSPKLQSQIQLPETPVCASCDRPVPEAGIICRWCLGQATVAASPSLQKAIDGRHSPECPGDGGLCGMPLGPGESRCARCKQQTDAPSAHPGWDRCKGRDSACGRRVLPGRGMCFDCRREAKATKLDPFDVRGRV